MTHFEFTKLIVIESFSTTERSTSKELYDDVLRFEK